MPIRLLLCAVIPPILWGTTYWLTTAVLWTERPLSTAMIRLLVPGLILLCLRRYWPRAQDWPPLLVVSLLCMGLMHACLFYSASRLAGPLAALLVCTQPLLVWALAWLLFRQRTRWIISCGAVLGFCGITLVLVAPSRMQWDMPAALAALLASASMGLGTLLMKRWKLNIPPLPFVGWQLLLGGLMVLPFAAWFEFPLPLPTLREVSGYGFLTLFGTLLPYYLWFKALPQLDPVQLSLFLLLSPLSAICIGYLLLGQALTPWQLLGAVVVFAGILLSQLQGPAAARR
ncbi:EamA family transporter [Pseudomonas sp. 5P_3.1_Bac2]|uniref:EamA family transporter n=1 Tax=Pseudomonas sp. 5P_3.1_Bac2 TaxID=2971617 RepID=UPI0021C7961E|nr:EamA family transporter [Pseudomonas sp. 5P_3.1_Bac2]MCU1719049.1 EamA family transporter [Pseudomonas sp. 5P_3.1_Bac2]